MWEMRMTVCGSANKLTENQVCLRWVVFSFGGGGITFFIWFSLSKFHVDEWRRFILPVEYSLQWQHILFAFVESFLLCYSPKKCGYSILATCLKLRFYTLLLLIMLYMSNRRVI